MMMRISLHPSLILYLPCVALLSSFDHCIGMLLALLVHEAGHYAASRIIGEQIARIYLTPFGGVMQYKRGVVPSKGVKGVFLHAAGPLGNYLFLLGIGLPGVQNIFHHDLLRILILANSSMLLFNLLPALPLDGGQIVFCIGYYLFPVTKLASVLFSLGILTGISGLMLSIYGLISHQMLNCSLVIVSLYLIVITIQSRKTLLAENICAVIQERWTAPPRIRRIEHYQVSPETPVLDLVPLIKENISISVSFSDDNHTRILTEDILCNALLSKSQSTLREAYALFSQYQEKKPSKP